MTAPWIGRRLGLDGNPLRRRTDKIAIFLAALLVAVFLIGAPTVSVAAIGWAGRSATAWQHTVRSWRQVLAIVWKAAPAPSPGSLSGYSWVPAHWTAPDGRARTGQIPVGVAAAAGQGVRLWVDAVGTPTGPPPRTESHTAVVPAATRPVWALCQGFAVLPLERGAIR